MNENEQQLTFEDAMKRLEKIVAKMESGELSLDDNIKYFEEGNKLTTYCEKQLHKAEKKVEVLLRKDANGQPVYQDFEPAD